MKICFIDGSMSTEYARRVAASGTVGGKAQAGDSIDGKTDERNEQKGRGMPVS